MQKKSRPSHKVQSTVGDYTYFVIQGLIGNLGSSTSEVVNFILKTWMNANQDVLANSGLTVKDWKAKRQISDSDIKP